eukprot:538260-Pelagomonas_calceolata.AAC.1
MKPIQSAWGTASEPPNLRGHPTFSTLRGYMTHEPLQFYWFRAAVSFYNALLRSTSNTLSKAWTGATCLLIVLGQGSL